jgi:putative ABC transport system permease protein
MALFDRSLYFLRLSLRHLFKKQLGYTLINISGLAVGFSCMLAAVIYSQDEFNYDQFHPQSEEVYRLVLDWDGDGVKRNWARTSYQVGNVGDQIPDINQLVRIRNNPGTDLIEVDNKPFYESRMLMVEPPFFDLFGFQLKIGDKSKVLNDKYSIVLTEATANKYFGTDNPIGKTVRFDGKHDLIVTGVAENPPSQSHIQFDGLFSFLLLEEIFSESRLMHWGQFDHYTYLRLAEQKTQSEVELKMSQFLKSNAPDWVNEKVTLKLQPIEEIHLNSKRDSELGINSDAVYSMVFLTASGLILLVALINYVNLSTATYLKRHKEMVMRKVLGSTRRELLKNVILESLLICLISIIIALFLTRFALSELELEGTKEFQSLFSFRMVTFSLCMTFFIGLLAGIFPALRLLQMSNDLGSKAKVKKSRFGQITITVQLVISCLLLIAMLGVSSQLKYFQNTSLGFESENILVIPIKDRSNNDSYKTTINRIKSIKGIESASFSSSTPGTLNSLTYTYKVAGANREEAAIGTIIHDEFYFDLYGIALKGGRYSRGVQSIENPEIVINQAAADFFELKEPIGKSVNGKIKGTIVGVVENFQVNSLHASMGPIIMYNYLPTLRFVSVKSEGVFDAEIIDELASVWSSIYENYPLEYSFLEEDNLKLYSFEQGIMKSLDVLVAISIFLAAIGLIGHATLLRQQKAQEYSLRKVLGGSFLQILSFSLRRLIPLVIIGSVLVSVLGYWGLNSWLQNFAFRITPGIGTFLFPVILMVLFIIVLVGSLLLIQLNQAPIKHLRDA